MFLGTYFTYKFDIALTGMKKISTLDKNTSTCGQLLLWVNNITHQAVDAADEVVHGQPYFSQDHTLYIKTDDLPSLPPTVQT